MLHPQYLAQHEGERPRDRDADGHDRDDGHSRHGRDVVGIDGVGDGADHLRQRDQEQPVHGDRRRRAHRIHEAQLHEGRGQRSRSAPLEDDPEELRHVQPAGSRTDEGGQQLDHGRRDPRLPGDSDLHADEEGQHRQSECHGPPGRGGFTQSIHRRADDPQPLLRHVGAPWLLGVPDQPYRDLLQCLRARAIDHVESACRTRDGDRRPIGARRVDQQDAAEGVEAQVVDPEGHCCAADDRLGLGAVLS